MSLRLTYTFLALVIVLSGIVRLIGIDQVPTSINNDQLHYATNAKFFFLTGRDFSGGITLPEVLLFQYPKNELPQAELPFFLAFPFVGIFPFSLTLLVLPNVILSCATVLVMYLIVRKLFGNTKMALIAALVTAINPWMIYIGRTSYEVVPATFFYLLSFYVLLVARGWKILYVVPILLLAFYSYIGTKLIFVPLVVLMLIYTYFFIHKKNYGMQYILVGISSLVLMLFFLFQIQSGADSSRAGEIVFFNHSSITESVDTLRKTTVDTPFVSLFDNKYTVYGRLLIANLLHIFDPDYLFLHGDNFFSVGRHGLFYVIDAIFILIGGAWLFIKKKSLFFFLSAFFVLATAPQIFHNSLGAGNFTPHIALIFPVLIIFISCGIASVIDYFKKSNKVNLSSLLLAGVYLASFSYFLHVYFFQFPLQSGIYDFPSRILSRYLVLASENEKKSLVVYSSEVPILLKKYLFYSNTITKDTVPQIRSGTQDNRYTIHNVVFVPCDDKEKRDPTKWIAIYSNLCSNVPSGKRIGIPQLQDSGSTYYIYEDILCTQHKLERYIRKVVLSDISVEKYSSEKFCQTFVLAVD